MSKKSTIHHFPVGNGDMTLIKIASNNQFHYVLVDLHIRNGSADDEDKCHAIQELHEFLEKDGDGRPYVDVMVLTHPDEDHIRGFKEHFHQGQLDNYVIPNDGERGKIIIREIWSSPLIFRRKSKKHTLCDDALTFNTEAKRRVNLYREQGSIRDQGDRIRLIGKDIEGKTDDIMNIVYQEGEVISILNEVYTQEVQVLVLGPLSDDEFEDSDAIDKNRSSIILQWGIASHGYQNPSNYILLAGDASVESWEILWKKHRDDVTKLQYDILLAPHHCSWHTLSHDSYSKTKDPKISEDARSALSQARTGAVIVSSSNTIKDDKNDPPNYGAKSEYEKIVDDHAGEFLCLADNIEGQDKAPSILTFKLTNEGPQRDLKPVKTSNNRASKRTAATSALFSSSGEAIGHG